MMRARSRRSSGNAAVELPFVLWFLFVLILFPMINLSTVCLRSYFLYQACHNAALTAAKAKSYQTTVGTDISAVDAANATVTRILSEHPGISVSSIVTQIVTTPLATPTSESAQTGRLTTPANTTLNAYQIRVTVVGACDPLIPFNLGFLGSIPGLTGPMSFTVRDQNFVENTQGLTR